MAATPFYQQQDFANKIVGQLQSYWTQTNTAKKDVDRRHDLIIESYNGILPERVRNAKAIQTKTHLGWTAKAVDTFTARLAPLLVPSAEKYFSLYDESNRYALACSVMSKMIAYFMETAGLESQIDRICDTLALEGALGLQPRWDYCYGLDQLPKLDLILVNSSDIGVYPVTEPIDRTVLMVRTYMTKQELLDMAMADPSQSFNIDAIQSLKQEDVFSRPVPTSSTNQTDTYNKRLGLEVIDYYAPMLKVDDQEFYHVRATVVKGKTLIRMVSKDDRNAYTPRGTTFVCLNELYIQRIGPVRVGVGLCNKAYDLEMAAITIHNLGIDNIKDTVKPPRTYDPKDTFFNKDRSGFAPGEFVASISTNPRHLMPIDASQRAVPQSEEMISRLMYQYEASVGIPNFLSGTSDTDDRRVSATAKRLEANGADTGLRKHAQNINARGLRPFTIDVYDMIRSALSRELGMVMQQAQQLQAQGFPINPQLIDQWVESMPFLRQAKAICPDFQGWFASGQGIPPISTLSLELRTFEDAVQKVDMVNSTERALGTLAPLGAQSPELAAALTAQIDLSALIRGYLNSLDLGNTLRPLSQVQERMEQNEQAQQQAQQKNEALQAAQMQMEAEKVQAETEKVRAETDKVAAETQKVNAETLQTIEETTNPKEPSSDGKSKPANSGTAKVRKS